MDYEDGDQGEFQETVNIMDLSLGRAPEPYTSNGEVRICQTLPVRQVPVTDLVGYQGLHNAGPQLPISRDRRIQS